MPGVGLASSAAIKKLKGSHQEKMRQDWTCTPEDQICYSSVAS